MVPQICTNVMPDIGWHKNSINFKHLKVILSYFQKFQNIFLLILNQEKKWCHLTPEHWKGVLFGKMNSTERDKCNMTNYGLISGPR